MDSRQKTVRTDRGDFGVFHHVGIVVSAEEFESTVDALCRLVSGTVSDGGEDETLDMRWVFVSSAHNPIFEVASPLGSRTTALTRHLLKHGGGLHHVSFETSDIGTSAGHVHRVDLPMTGADDDHAGYAEHFIQPRALGGALFHAFEDRREV